MRFIETPVQGMWIIEPELIEDERGFFARTMDAAEFTTRGLVVPITQWSISFNRKRGTLRGLHYQARPAQEVKLIRCTAGAVFDVVVNLSTRQWFGVELSAKNRRALYVPHGMAHGFQTIREATEVSYAIQGGRVPELERGIAWNDPALAIAWPLAVAAISERDRAFPWLNTRENRDEQ